MSYTTPEGFRLERKLAFPEAHTFTDVLNYQGEWNSKPSWPQGKVGPYCSIDLSQTGGPKHRAVAARLTDEAFDRLVHDGVLGSLNLNLRIISHAHTGRALVLAQYDQILGDHWLAYIDPDTIPTAPAELGA